MYPGSILVTLANASHAGFAQPASTIMRFIDNPDGIGCSTVVAAMGDTAAEPDAAFMTLLGGAEDGIDLKGKFEFCQGPLVPVTMKASRQHMFATLASYAFLESVFADSAAVRDTSRQYLLHTLPEENSSEVSVSL
jgi:hypothetical protein